MTHASVLAISAGLALAMATTGSQAQQAPKASEKKEIIIREKGGEKEKMTIVIDGDKVTVNGKPLAEYDGDNIVIRKRNMEDMAPYVYVNPRMAPSPRMHRIPEPPRARAWRYSMGDEDMMWKEKREPRAFLGVVTDKDAKGALITEVSPESAAAKAGLKKGDIITAVGGKAVVGPETLVELIRARKPDEEVEIGYLRDKKKKTLKVKLGKQDLTAGRTFEIMVPGIEEEIMRDLEPEMRRLHRELEPEMRRSQREMERMHRELQREQQNMDGFRWDMEPFEFRMLTPKMGIRIEDMEDGKGVKITDVEAGSAAEKAGLKKDDILTFIDGKKINNTDDARSSMREGRDKASLPVSVTRDGKPFNVEVKMPRDLKKADLEP
ncbi:MAG: PDZ domain-containing protein [Chitinophagaceae bacterium]|nr:PDZ domain-containing protein [Chitinophagaceae bacterium]